MTSVRSSFALLAVLVGAGVGGAAFAATFNVNSTFDVAAAPPLNNGICETAPGNGVCTLRAAVMKGNHFPGGGVTINVPASALPYKLTTVPAGANDETTGDLNITAAMTIAGAGVATIIDGNGTDRVFRIATPGAAVTINGVTIRNGTTASIGGGIYVEPGSGPFVLSNSAIIGSSGFHGGGIFSGSSTVTLSGVTISGNVATFQGGGVFTDGFLGSMTINDCLISDNSAGTDGGGIGLHNASVITRSVVAGNRAGGVGGGIAIEGVSLQIANSTINANHSAADGGGISSFQTPVTIQNSTVSANGAHANGGGIRQAGMPGILRLFHVTVAGNAADTDLGGIGTGGGLYRAAASDANEVWNSLLVENSADGAASDCAGDPTTSQDYNYFQSFSGCIVVGTLTHNVPAGGDPLLEGLRDNGGTTPTRALFDSSPALDWIPSVSCRDALGAAPNPDQRGVARPVGPQCDVGAYEGSRSASLLGRNLIRNGDAENGAGSTSGVFVQPPNWEPIQSEFTVVPYGSAGGFPSALTDIVPANHGYNFFAGGLAAFSVTRQMITVASLSAPIDAGQITYDLDGDFGGFADQDDQAGLIVVFRDVVSNPIGGSHEIGHVLAADRGNATGFRHRSLSGAVPAGTRMIEVSVSMMRASVSGYNDAYADNLSLVLTGGTPPALQSVVSRKAHAAAGTFDLALSTIPTNPSTEPRQGPAQTIVFSFDKPINAATATITEGVATAAAPTFSGNDVSVSLSGVSNQQYVTVSLTNVASSDGGSGGSGSVRIGFLVGDVSQNRVVTVADLGLVNAQLAQSVTTANYLKDVNASGTLTVADKGITNANLTLGLPAP